MVRDHIPLEQGLRHHLSLSIRESYRSQRPYSIRTRIKTEDAAGHDLPGTVRDHIPLEQGLRPDWDCFKVRQATVRDHIPLEQGLRRNSCWTE